jgi:hypothetical protein
MPITLQLPLTPSREDRTNNYYRFVDSDVSESKKLLDTHYLYKSIFIFIQSMQMYRFMLLLIIDKHCTIT